MWMRSAYFAARAEIIRSNRKLILEKCARSQSLVKTFLRPEQYPRLWCQCRHGYSYQSAAGTKLNRANYNPDYNGTKKCAYASTFTSQRKILRTRELLALLAIGVTGGVVYGLNKKYEHDKFDRKMDEINQLIKKAEEKQKEIAVRLYREALRLVKVQIDAEQSQSRMSILTTKFVFIIDQLANLMHGLGRLDEAEDYYKQTLRGLLAHHTKQDDDCVIEISLKLASIYAEQKRHKLAETGYTWCVENARKKVNDGDEKVNVNSSALLGICLESFGKYASAQNQLSKAISLFSEALKISRNIFGEDHSQVLLLLNNLGVAHFEAGDVEISKTYFNQAINLSEGKTYEDIWSFHFNLADVLAQTGSLEEAKMEYEKSMELCPNEETRRDIKENILRLS